MYGGRTRAIAIQPDITSTVFVAAEQSGLYRSTDGGQHWELTLHSPTFVAGLVQVWPVTPTVVFAGGAEGLYRSEQGASPGSWTRVAATSPISPVYRIVFAPGHPEIIYLGTGNECHWCDGNGIWRSRDGGQTWERLNSTLNGLRVLALAVHPANPDTLLAGVWSGSNDGQGIYRSTDGGDTWQPVSGLSGQEERKVPDIAYDPANPQIVYAATHGGLRVSFDGGLSWGAYPGPMGQLPMTAMTAMRHGEQTDLYLGTVGGAVAGQLGARHVAQAESIMGAGVYQGQSHWHFVHLPLVLRSP